MPMRRTKCNLSKVQFELLFQTAENNEVKSHKRRKYGRIIQVCLCGTSPNTMTAVDQMDISLLSAVIKSCCKLSDADSQCIRDITDTRDALASSLTITKSKFDHLFSKTEFSVLGLARVFSNVIQRMIKTQISTSKKNEQNSIDSIVRVSCKLYF